MIRGVVAHAREHSKRKSAPCARVLRKVRTMSNRTHLPRGQVRSLKRGPASLDTFNLFVCKPWSQTSTRTDIGCRLQVGAGILIAPSQHTRCPPA